MTTTGPSRRTTGASGLAVAAAPTLALPAIASLDSLGRTTSVLDVTASFLVVAALEVVAARGLYLLARERAHPAAYAALLSRVGHALLLAVAATVLARRGADGAAAFRSDWSAALLVLAVHLVVAGIALWRARTAPRALSAAVALGGLAALGVMAAAAAGAGDAPALVPVLVGEAALATALLSTAVRRPGLRRVAVEVTG